MNEDPGPPVVSQGKHKVKKGTFKRLMSFAKPESGKLAIGLVSLLVASSMNMAYPKIMGKVIDRTVSSRAEGGSASSDKAFFGGAIGLMALGACASWLRVYLLSSASDNTSRRLRCKLFESLLEQEAAFFDEHASGTLVAVITEDVDAAADACTSQLANGLRSLSSAFNGSCLLVYISPRLALLSTGLLPLVGVGAMALTKRMRKRKEAERVCSAKATAFAGERLRQIQTVRMFAREHAESSAFSNLTSASWKLRRTAASAQGVQMGVLSAAGNASLLAVLYFGSSQVASGLMSMGDLTSFTIYSGLVGLGFSGLSSFYSELSKGLASAERVFDLIDRVPETHIEGGMQLEKVEGHLELEDVCFTYPSRDQPVLKGITLSIAAGSTLAIAGESGVGKSTLLSVIARLYDPQSGTIFLDGVDTTKLDASWLRRQIAVVQQNAPLLSGTVEDNIRYGNPRATFAEVVAAAREANADTFIESFPEGYATMVGEDGKQLSGGQRQRVAIARALLCGAKIMVFDEATSNLDGDSERLIREALDRIIAGGGKTLLIIAHRQSTIERAHKVAVLNDGRVVEQGKCEDLLQNPKSELHRLMGGGYVSPI